MCANVMLCVPIMLPIEVHATRIACALACVSNLFANERWGQARRRGIMEERKKGRMDERDMV